MPWSTSNSPPRWRLVLDTAASVAMIAASVAVVWALVGRSPGNPAPAARPQPPLPSEPVSLAGAALKGDVTAPVAVIEYSEFQCPYCGKSARDTLPGLVRTYVTTGKVLLAFRHLPLEKMHPAALKAAQAAECAGQQGKFWEMHDLLFQNAVDLDAASFPSLAQAIGLDRNAFAGCTVNDFAMTKVIQDIGAARTLQVTGTPTFLIGIVQQDRLVRVVRRIVGAQPLSAFSDVIEQLLKEARRK
jgi:protein-disulfide isomerase